MNLIPFLNSLNISELYLSSNTKLPDGELVMVRMGPDLRLAVSGRLCGEFNGALREGDVSFFPLNHENRLVLNRLFPWTAPVPFGREGSSFGFGDRQGFANAAQIRSVAKTSVRPVLAQQSLRELQLTGRTLTEVMDCAAWAAFREGYRLGYACDGDHLKTLEEVRAAVAEGVTMVTLDCSLVLRSIKKSAAEFHAEFLRLPEGIQNNYKERYLCSCEAESLSLHYTEALLGQLHTTYGEAFGLICEVFRQVLIPAGRAIDLEISLDETEETTTPEAHYFVARELEAAGVAVTSMAPKFVGEFQKAIDYIGDLDELRSTMSVHARIAKRFDYKLSLHSASEKFSALPILAEVTGGRYHVKTSGTSWLEVVEAVAKTAPSLYRRIHRQALESVDQARTFYAVHCDPDSVPPLESVSDADLPFYLMQNDSRQFLHITYGYILAQPELRQAILEFLKEHRTLYESEIENLYDRHFAALQVPKNTIRKG